MDDKVGLFTLLDRRLNFERPILGNLALKNLLECEF